MSQGQQFIFLCFCLASVMPCFAHKMDARYLIIPALIAIVILIILSAIITFIENRLFDRMLPSHSFAKTFYINVFSGIAAACYYVWINLPGRVPKFLASYPNLDAYLWLAFLFFLTKSVIILFVYKNWNIKSKRIIFNFMFSLVLALFMWGIVTFLLGYR